MTRENFSLPGFLIITLAMLCPLRAWAAENSISMIWNKESISTLEQTLRSSDDIQRLLYAIVKDDSADDQFHLDLGPKVLDYKFLDLNGDGKVELVCRLDYSGRGLALYIATIAKDNDGRLHASLLDPQASVSELSDIVQDLNHDGRKELVIRRPLQPGKDRGTPTPFFVDVYRYGPRGFRIADPEFTQFYKRTLLPQLTKQLRAISTNAEPSESGIQATDDTETAALTKSIEALKIYLLAR